MRISIRVLFGSFLLCGFTQAWADQADDDEMQRAQRQMNKEVMDKPFFAEEPEKVDAYILEASKKHIKPIEYTGPHWKDGYTCNDMLQYSWTEFRDCRYYHHYYGHYYPY